MTVVRPYEALIQVQEEPGEDQKDQVTIKQLGGSPIILLPLSGPPGLLLVIPGLPGP